MFPKGVPNPICFAQSPPFLTYIGGPKGEALFHLPIESSILGSLHSFNFFFFFGGDGHLKKSLMPAWAGLTSLNYFFRLPPLCQKFKYMITPSPILNLTMVSSTAPPVQIPPSGTYRDSKFLGAEARPHSKPDRPPGWSSTAVIAAVTGYSGRLSNYSTCNRRFSRTFKTDQHSREIVLTGDHRLREPVSGGRQFFFVL